MIIALPGAVVKLFAFVILHKIFPEHIHAQTPRADQVAPASARPRILIHGLRVFIHLYSKKIPVRKSVSLPEGCPESLIPWAVLASPLSTLIWETAYQLGATVFVATPYLFFASVGSAEVHFWSVGFRLHPFLSGSALLRGTGSFVPRPRNANRAWDEAFLRESSQNPARSSRS